MRTSFGRNMIRHHLLALSCIGFLGSACSVVVDSDRVQCKTNSDCSSQGEAFASYVCSDSVCQPDPTWACLDNPDVTSAETVHVVFTLLDLLSQKPVPGVRLTLCAKMDADCLLPIAQYQSDADGKLDIEMPTGFDGYFQTEAESVYPTLFFPPNTRKQRAKSTLPMVPASFFSTMFSNLGVTVASDRTAIMTTAWDCTAKPAPGMILASPQIDDRAVTYYLHGGLPSHTAVETDGDGAGGFVNIKAGNAVVTSTIAATNRLVGTVAVQTRPGHLTMVLVTPSGG
jgi:hypothetical protein